MKNQRSITVVIPTPVKDEIDKLRKTKGISTRFLINDLLEKYLSNYF